MMRWAFLISTILELVGGLVFYLYPGLIFENPPLVANKLYAVAAITVAIFNFSCYKLGPDTAIWKNAVLAMLFFHAAVAMICFSAPAEIIPVHMQACLTHLAMWVLFFISYMKDLKPESP